MSSWNLLALGGHQKVKNRVVKRVKIYYFFRAARVQNETALEKILNRYEKRFEKREKGSEKRSETRLKNF